MSSNDTNPKIISESDNELNKEIPQFKDLEPFRQAIGADCLNAFYNNLINNQLMQFNPVNTRSLWNIHAVGSQISRVLERTPAILIPGSLSKVQVDCIEYPEFYKAFIDIPGVKKENLDIHIEDRVLLIQGDRNLDYGIDADCLHRERFYGPFIVSIPIGMDYIDIDNVKAVINDGVLVITLMKIKEPIEKRIHLVEFEQEEEIKKIKTDKETKIEDKPCVKKEKEIQTDEEKKQKA